MVIITLTLTEDREADLRNRLEHLRRVHREEMVQFEKGLADIPPTPKRTLEANLKRDELLERGKRITIHNLLRVAVEHLPEVSDQELLNEMATEGIARGRPRVSQG